MVRVLESNIFLRVDRTREGRKKQTPRELRGVGSIYLFGRCCQRRRWRRHLVDHPGRVVGAYDTPDGQDNSKRGAFAEDALGEDMAAKSIHELPGDAEAQSSAAEFTGP